MDTDDFEAGMKKAFEGIALTQALRRKVEALNLIQLQEDMLNQIEVTKRSLLSYVDALDDCRIKPSIDIDDLETPSQIMDVYVALKENEVELFEIFISASALEKETVFLNEFSNLNGILDSIIAADRERTLGALRDDGLGQNLS